MPIRESTRVSLAGWATMAVISGGPFLARYGLDPRLGRAIRPSLFSIFGGKVCCFGMMDAATLRSVLCC